MPTVLIVRWQNGLDADEDHLSPICLCSCSTFVLHYHGFSEDMNFITFLSTISRRNRDATTIAQSRRRLTVCPSLW